MVIIIVTWAKVMFVLLLNYLRFLLLTDYNLQSVVIQSYANNVDGELQDKMFGVMAMKCCYPLLLLVVHDVLSKNVFTLVLLNERKCGLICNCKLMLGIYS